MNKLWMLSIGLVLLAWFISSSIPSRRPPLVNYDTMVFFNRDVYLNPNGPLYLLPTKEHPNGVYANTNLLLPRSKEEIEWIIKSVAATYSKVEEVSGSGYRRGRRIRVLGSGHSWSKVAKSDDIQLSLENYKGIVSVDNQKLMVTVRSGTTLRELNSMLDGHGLAMKVLGSISDQTVGGAISTATHGSGVGHANLAAMVTKLELINGEGDVLTLTHQSNPEIFKAAQVSLGLFGIITEVTFQCESAFNLQEIRYTIPLQECLHDIDNIAHSGQHVKYWIDLHTEKCAVHMVNRTSSSPRDNPNHSIESIQNHILEFIIHLCSWFPNTIPGTMKFIFDVLPDALPPYNRVDKSYRVFNIPHFIPVHNEGEIIVDMKDCADAIREQRRFVFESGIPLNYVTEIRFVKSDDIWLSPNYQRDSCHITLCIHNPSKEMRELYFYGLFRALHRYKPRVHWGKEFSINLEDVQSMYPKLTNFLAIREQMDPHRIFVNDLLAKTLELSII